MGGAKCDIVEFIMATNYGGSSYPNAPSAFLNKFDKVKQITYGGCYYLHQDGPVGLNGPYTTYSSGSGSGSKSSDSDSDNLFIKVIRAIGQFLRNGWISLATLVDNQNTGLEAESVMISLFS